jgi:hypothetical protein
MRTVRIPARAALAGVLFLCAAELLYAGRHVTFFYDEWDFVTGRRGTGAATFLEPHNEHLSLIPVAIYKLLFAAVGLSHHWVYRAVLVALLLVVGVLVFSLARSRVGDGAAVAAAALVLFLGKAWEDLLWAFQIGFVTSVAAGLGALLALERDDRRGDVIASVLLGVGLASSSLGIPIVIGVTAEIVWSGRWRRLALLVPPVALYGLWYLHYGASALKSDNIIGAADYAIEAAAGAMGALAGQGLDWGRPLLVAALIGLGLRLAVPGRISARLVGVLVAAAAFWVLTGIARAGLSEPDAPRYLYPGAVLIVLAGCELLRGARPDPRQLSVVAGAATLAVALGAPDLRAGARFLRSTSESVQAELGALALVGPRADPGYQFDPKLAPQLRAGTYAAAVAWIGSTTADTPAELQAAGSTAREQADRVLAEAGGLALTTARGATTRAALTLDGATGGAAERRGSCVRFRASRGGSGGVELALPAGGGLTITAAGAPAEVRVRRFFDVFRATPVGIVTPAGARALQLRADASPASWHVRLDTRGAVTACGLAR